MLETHRTRGDPPGAAALAAPFADLAEPRPAAGVPPPTAPGPRLAAAVRFMLDEWLVDVPAQAVQRGAERVALEPRQMAVLATLCRHPGEVISADALLDLCWAGQSIGDNPVHKAIASLRRALGDSATAPRYIETVRKQGYRLVAPVRVVAADDHRRHAGGWRGSSPFRGLEAFDAQHASVFFGRDESVTLLRACLGEQWRRGHGLVVLLGASGSGKTSLVQAGLLPALLEPPPARGGAETGFAALRACAAAVVDLGAHDASGAWGALAGGLLDWEVDGRPLLPGYSIATLADELRDDPQRALLALRLVLQTLVPAAGGAAPPLLVLDRLEALFQAPLDADAAAVVRALEALVRSGLLLLLCVCRNDFYAHVAAHRLFMQGKPFGAHVDLGPPDAEALAQIVRLPARVAGLSYSTDPTGLHRLDDRLCADAMRAPDALPLLQYTLQSLYLARAPGDLLTWEAYDALDGLEGAVGQRAEAVLAALPARQQRALPGLLPRLIGLTAGDAAASGRWMRECELAGADEAALVQALVAARLLVADRVAGAAGVRIAHEALLRRWPRVAGWIAQHRSMLAVRDELLPWVRRWHDGGRAQALLLPRGLALWRVVDAVAQAPALFSQDEQDFVARSQHRVRRQGRLRWAACAGAALLALLAGAAAVRNAQLARIAAQREQQSRRLASFMLGDLADQLRPLGKIGLLASIGEQGEKLLGQPGGAESPLDALQRAKALVVIGEAQGSRGAGRTEVATTALRAAYALLEPLEAGHPGRPAEGLPAGEYYKTLGASAFWLGQIAYDHNQLDAAAAQMERYRAACERWRAAAPGDAQASTELAFAYSSLGSVALRRGAWAEATRWHEAALELKLLALAARPQDADLAYAVANARTWLGELAYIQGEQSRALALYESVFAIEDGLRMRFPDQLLRWRDLGVAQMRRAEALLALGRRDDAVNAMRRASLFYDRVANADPKNRAWRLDRLSVESGLLLTLQDSGQPYSELLRTLRAHLVEAGPALHADEKWRSSNVRALLVEAQGHVGRGDWPAAARLARQAEDEVGDLLLIRPHYWQAYELRARLDRLGMRIVAESDSQGAGASDCRRRADGLRPAIASGQRGLVLETWLLARRCAGERIEPAWLNQLTAGGYRPVALNDPSTTTTRR